METHGIVDVCALPAPAGGRVAVRIVTAFGDEILLCAGGGVVNAPLPLLQLVLSLWLTL